MSSSPLSSPSLFLPSRSPSPLVFQIDPDYDYNREDRLQIAIAHYDTQKKNYAQGKGKKQNLLRLSKLYEVKESTMRYRIKNLTAKSNVVVQSKNTPAQEKKPIARWTTLIFQQINYRLSTLHWLWYSDGRESARVESGTKARADSTHCGGRLMKARADS
jgi:hypothetical protein